MKRNAELVAKTLDGRPLLHLALPPSTNQRMKPIIVRRRPRLILTTEARAYIRRVGRLLAAWAKRAGFRPIARQFVLPIWVVVPRSNCDPHNYEKVLFDALERGGIVANDKYILPQYQGAGHDPKAPGVTVLL